MLKWAALLLLPLLVRADERWVEFHSGTFEVLTAGADRNARDVLNQLDQMSWLLGAALGKPELKTIWPVRIVVFKTPQQAGSYAGASVPKLARDAYVAAVAGNSLPPDAIREFVRLLITQNAKRMPAGIEAGLETFYATAQVAGTIITLGAPPPPAARNQDWARINLLVTSPDYAGKLRILLFNLQQGSDPDPAFRNAFGKSQAEIDKQAAAMLASGNFGTAEIGGKPLNALRDYTPERVESAVGATALADLALVGGGDAAAAYRVLLPQVPAAAHEGLGLIAVKAGRQDEARKELAAAADAGSKSARAWLEAARLNPDKAKAAAGLQKAAELNPNWAEPYALLAQNESDPSRKLNWLKMAADREPRNAAIWRAVAELYQTHNKYPEAAKAWAAAESASVDDAERNQMVEARRAIDEKRLAFEAEERKRREREKQQGLQKVKDEAMARIHAAENRANTENPRQDSGGKVVEWWGDGAAPAKAEGQLVRTECTGRIMRLVIRGASGRETRLLIRDPRKIVVIGGGELSLKCGAQSPARAVSAEYVPKADPKLGTAGEIASIEFK